MSLAYKIKNLRADKKWTQRDLSIASGVTSETISRIENEHILDPNEPTLRCLASALNVTLEDLQK